MRGPKDRLAQLLHRFGITRYLARFAAGRLTVFGYHHVQADAAADNTPFDEGVAGPSVAEFRRQLRWLRRHTSILSEAELLDLLESGRSIPQPASYITFDDAYRDNYTVALPVLEELGIPATFFIPTDLVDRRQLGWWDLISYFLKETAKTSIRYTGVDYDLGSSRRHAIDQLIRLKRTRNAEETEHLLSELSEICAVPFPDRTMQDAQLMTWAQVRDAARRGVSIGSHSHTHRVLRTLTRPALEEELRLSKTVLENNIQGEIHTLAYPCGSYQDFDRSCQQVAEHVGYRLAFSFNTGVNSWGAIAPFDVRRVAASSCTARLAAIAVLPSFFSWRATP